MIDKNTKACFASETYHEGENKILKISLEKCPFPPSIEYSEVCMGKVIDLLLQNSGVSTIILTQQRHYEYDTVQTALLTELATLYKAINHDNRYSYSQLLVDPQHEQYIRGNYARFQRIISKKLKDDPLAAFVELKRLERHEKNVLNNIINQDHANSQQRFVQIMVDVIQKVEHLKIIQLLMPHTQKYSIGKREVYSYALHPTTHPDFMYTKLIRELPEGNLLESYQFIANDSASDVNIFGFDNDIRTLYHLTPPEFRFSEEEYQLLDDAKRIMSEHKPTQEEFVNPERMREVFLNIGKDLLRDLLQHKQMSLTEQQINQLAQALLRYTVGFGLIELLLADPKVQDVNINSPNGELPIFIVHQDFGDCYTNIYPTRLEVESWATKLRLISGRPLDEANPILDTELKVEGFTSRVSAINAPLNPSGLAFSFRRHRDFPWTFPLYTQPKIRYINNLAAGLISFLINNNATILVAGTRSSGKSSLLGSFLVEITRRSRIVTIEDTFELPQESLRALGYNIESLKVASALASESGSEVDPSIGIRSTLRLGDSAIFVGEVRSKEAIALFEAMRVGAAANVVAEQEFVASITGEFVPESNFSFVLTENNKMEFNGAVYEICDGPITKDIDTQVRVCKDSLLNNELLLDKPEAFDGTIRGVYTQLSPGEKIIIFQHVIGIGNGYQFSNWEMLTNNLAANRNPLLVWDAGVFELFGSEGISLLPFGLKEYPFGSANFIQLNETLQGFQSGFVTVGSEIFYFEQELAAGLEEDILLNIKLLDEKFIGDGLVIEGNKVEFVTEVGGEVYTLTIILSADDVPTEGESLIQILIEDKVGTLLFKGNVYQPEPKEILLSNGVVVVVDLSDWENKMIMIK